MTPLDALRRAVLPALSASPCLVAFSGGRDSALVLSAATSAAREHGLAPPVPITLRFAGDEESNESVWQERVVRHLGLEDWVRLDLTDELDYLGPISQRLLRRHGVIDPPNISFFTLPLEHARGGTLLTGIGGDDIFLLWRWRRAVNALTGRIPPRPANLARVGMLLLPGAVRSPIHARRMTTLVPAWLRPEAAEALLRGLVAEDESQPRRWDRWLDWLVGRRAHALWHHCFRLLEPDAEARIVNPLFDREFLATLARAGGRYGWRDRTSAMVALFSGALPDDVLRRPVKALFDNIFVGPRARAYMREWDGTGVDTELVDVQALRSEWAKPVPRYHSMLLLHTAWLAQHGRETAVARS